MFFAYAMVWVSVSAAVIYGIYHTGSLFPLWTFFFPLMISLRARSDSDEQNNNQTR